MDAWSNPAASIGRTRTAEFMAAVYRWMALALALTGLTAWAVLNTDSLRNVFFSVRGEQLVPTGAQTICGLAALAIVFFFRPIVARASVGVALGVFLLFSVLLGASLSTIALVYTGGSIASTLFVTGGAFAGLSFYGTVSKRDLSAWGTFLMVGLIGLVLAGLVNLFLHSAAVEFVLSCAGVVVFAGLTAYDTQRIRAMGETGDDRHAIMGALALYLDFINLFLYLLRFLGRRRD